MFDEEFIENLNDGVNEDPDDVFGATEEELMQSATESGSAEFEELKRSIQEGNDWTTKNECVLYLSFAQRYSSKIEEGQRKEFAENYKIIRGNIVQNQQAYTTFAMMCSSPNREEYEDQIQMYIISQENYLMSNGFDMSKFTDEIKANTSLYGSLLAFDVQASLFHFLEYVETQCTDLMDDTCTCEHDHCGCGFCHEDEEEA